MEESQQTLISWSSRLNYKTEAATPGQTVTFIATFISPIRLSCYNTGALKKLHFNLNNFDSILYNKLFGENSLIT